MGSMTRESHFLLTHIVCGHKLLPGTLDKMTLQVFFTKLNDSISHILSTGPSGSNWDYLKYSAAVGNYQTKGGSSAVWTPPVSDSNITTGDPHRQRGLKSMGLNTIHGSGKWLLFGCWSSEDTVGGGGGFVLHSRAPERNSTSMITTISELHRRNKRDFLSSSWKRANCQLSC